MIYNNLSMHNRSLPTSFKERPMFARHVSITLKPDSAREFVLKFETDVLPVLKSQNGFQDEVTLLGDSDRAAIAISLWDRKESADVYARDTYPQVLKSLGTLIEGTPKVNFYDVASSTFHNIPAHA
jgi:hypothetical protein